MSQNLSKHTHFKKSAARLYATQALFQMEVSKSPLDEITDEFEVHRIGASIDERTYNEADLEMFRAITNNAVKQQSRIDKLTNQSLKDSWPLNRIDPTLRALFRAATSELLIDETPHRAVINEFIEISKAFFPNGKETKLVNGVLDNILSLIVNDLDK
jgi:N utilization substance protein B